MIYLVLIHYIIRYFLSPNTSLPLIKASLSIILTVKLIMCKVYYVFSIFENKEEKRTWQWIIWSMTYWPFIISFAALHTLYIGLRLLLSSTGYCVYCAVKARLPLPSCPNRSASPPVLILPLSNA